MTKYSCSLKPERSNSIRLMAKRISKTFLVIIGSAVCLGAVVYYLAQVNYISESGFAQRELEQKIDNLRDENEKLQLQTVALKSMSGLSERVQKLGMVPVGDMQYFDTTGQLVAKR